MNLTSRSLILGDGNFSFSYAYYEQISVLTEGISSAVKIYCTSFDSDIEIAQKYPESEKYLKSLRRDPSRVTVLHNVDATQLDSFPFHNPSESELNSSKVSSAFNEVIFNFPHLGYEDLMMHQSLIAHILHSIKQVLAPNAVAIISLAQSQQIGWKLNETAERLGFQFLEKIPLDLNCWPGYELKRHHTGKSFKNRVQDCYHYLFQLTDNSISSPSTWFKTIYENYAQKKSVAANEVTTANQPIEANMSNEIIKNCGKNKKRKVHQLVEGHYEEIINDSSSTTTFRCKFCDKIFPSDQGIRTHVYTVHILPNNQNVPKEDSVEPEKSQKIACEYCEKEFSNEDSHYQHLLSKHRAQFDVRNQPMDSSVSTEKPETQTLPGNLEQLSFECLICQRRFSSEDDLSHHLQHGFEPKNAEYQFNCQSCNKAFTNDRAWRQHSNFCVSKHQSVSLLKDQAVSV
eukprot:gene696-744_t